MSQTVTVERLTTTASDAIMRGSARVLLDRDGRPRRQVEYNVQPHCDNPVGFETHARHSVRHGKKVKPLTVFGLAPCRRCEKCLKVRSWLWQERAIAEFNQHTVTLFGTITMAPDEHYALDARLTLRLAAKGVKISDLTAREIWGERVKEFGFELTKYLKRIRKARKQAPIRYLLVAEPHDSEATSVMMRHRPHYHLLFHLKPSDQPYVEGDPIQAMIEGESGEYALRKDGSVYLTDQSFLRTNWHLGFTKFRWAQDTRAAWYLCKYLTKCSDARVRASQHYGRLGEAGIKHERM